MMRAYTNIKSVRIGTKVVDLQIAGTFGVRDRISPFTGTELFKTRKTRAVSEKFGRMGSLFVGRVAQSV